MFRGPGYGRPGNPPSDTMEQYSSEVTWMGMLKATNKIGMRPKAWRNDHLWLTGDHIVDTRHYDSEKKATGP